MSDIIQLTIISSDKATVNVEISEIYIPAFYGEAGILEHHLPFITMLGAGEVSYKDSKGKKHFLFVNGGFLENRDNKIFLIADELENAEDLNPDKIKDRLSEVDKLIKSSIKGEISPEELEAIIKEQKNLRSKIEIIEELKG